MYYNIHKISLNQTFGTYRIFNFLARLTTLNRPIAKVVLSICMSRSQSILHHILA